MPWRDTAEGTYYLAGLQPLLLENSRVSDFMCEEDAFLFYLQQAQRQTKRNMSKHLRHALQVSRP